MIMIMIMNLSVDCDGVLVDYNAGYIRNWEKMFGYRPKEVDPTHYMITKRFDIPTLVGYELTAFRDLFDNEYWETLEPLPGVVEACNLLQEKGFTLYCNTALDHKYRNARIKNLENIGLKFEDVLTCPAPPDYDRHIGLSPKIDICKKINAVAHIDDHLPFFRGIPHRIGRFFINSTYPTDDATAFGLGVDSIDPSLLLLAQSI